MQSLYCLYASFRLSLLTMKTKETLPRLHNIEDHIFSNFNEHFSTCLVVYKLKYYHKVSYVSKRSFFWNSISCSVYYNNVKDHLKEVALRCSVKKVFLKFRKIQRKPPTPNSQVPDISMTLAQVFSREFCNVYKSTFCIKPLR